MLSKQTNNHKHIWTNKGLTLHFIIPEWENILEAYAKGKKLNENYNGKINKDIYTYMYICGLFYYVVLLLVIYLNIYIFIFIVFIYIYKLFFNSYFFYNQHMCA